MSNYKTHVAFNLGFGLPLTIAAGAYYLQPSKLFVLVFALSFVYATLYMGPDMDLAKSIRLFSLRGLFTLPFRSYSRIFRHRGLSHSLLLGTLTRLAWLVLCFFIVSYLLDFLFGWKLKSIQDYWQTYRPYIFYVAAGIFFADVFHLILDMKKS